MRRTLTSLKRGHVLRSNPNSLLAFDVMLWIWEFHERFPVNEIFYRICYSIMEYCIEYSMVPVADVGYSIIINNWNVLV